jgi:hypothetical protein
MSFPGANLLYSSPATPFVIVFTLVGLYAWWVTSRSVYRRFSTSQYSSLPSAVAKPGSSHSTPSGIAGV